MPPSIIAIDANNLHHVYSRQQMQQTISSSSSNGNTIPALIEVSTNRCSSNQLGQDNSTDKKRNKKKSQKRLPVSIHMPVPLANVDSSFHSMDGLSTTYSMVRDQLRDQMEPRYRRLLAQTQLRKTKHQKLQKQLNDLKQRMHTISRSKRVRFASPIITEVHTRPYTDIVDIPKLFFQEEELDQFEQDRYGTVADMVECAFVEEVYAISVAYKRRTSVDE